MRHDYFNIHKMLEEVIKPNEKYYQPLLEDHDRHLIQSTQDKLKQSEIYIKKRFDNVRNDSNLKETIDGPRISRSKVETAGTQFKTDENFGSYKIYPHILKLIRRITSVCLSRSLKFLTQERYQRNVYNPSYSTVDIITFP